MGPSSRSVASLTAASCLYLTTVSWSGCGNSGNGAEGSSTLVPQCVLGEGVPLADDEPTPWGQKPNAVWEYIPAMLPINIARTEAEPARAGTLHLKAEPGTARHLPGERKFENAGNNADAGCRGVIEQTVSIELHMPDDNGGISTVGKLTSHSPHSAKLFAGVAMEDVQHVWEFEPAEAERLNGAQLHVQLAPEHSAGTLDVFVQKPVHKDYPPAPPGAPPPQRDYVEQRTVTALHWPANTSCKPGDLSLSPKAEAYDVSAQQVLAPFQAAFNLTWSDGSRSTLTLSPLFDAESCLSASVWSYPMYEVEAASANPFYASLHLELKSEDGRIQRRVPGLLTYDVEPDGGLVRAALEVSDELAPGDEGGWDAALGPHDVPRKTSLRLSYHFPAAVSGTLGLMGWEMEACPPSGPCVVRPPGYTKRLQSARVEPKHP